MKIIPETCHVY